MITFENGSKYFFWIAGVVTTIGALPTMLSPVMGLELSMGLTYFDVAPQVSPLIGHWGIMVTGIGLLLFASASNKSIRKTTAIFSTLEKAYMVGFAIYGFYSGAPYAGHYISALVADSLMIIGGVWYLMQSRKTGNP